MLIDKKWLTEFITRLAAKFEKVPSTTGPADAIFSDVIVVVAMMRMVTRGHDEAVTVWPLAADLLPPASAAPLLPRPPTIHSHESTLRKMVKTCSSSPHILTTIIFRPEYDPNFVPKI